MDSITIVKLHNYHRMLLIIDRLITLVPYLEPHVYNIYITSRCMFSVVFERLEFFLFFNYEAFSLHIFHYIIICTSMFSIVWAVASHTFLLLSDYKGFSMHWLLVIITDIRSGNRLLFPLLNPAQLILSLDWRRICLRAVLFFFVVTE